MIQVSTPRFRRQAAFSQAWLLVATSPLVFACLVLLSTGPRL